MVLEPDTPFRILLLGDFSGRTSSDWRPVEIDRDNFEDVLARLAPSFSGMKFRELDDFHPDRIYQSPLFAELREERRKVDAGGSSRAKGAKAEAERPPLPDLASGASLLDSMMEADEPKAAPPVTHRGGLEAVVESVVAPYRVPAENPELPGLRAKADEDSSALMRAILHHPAFQAVEAAWRAVFHLVRAVETGTQLRIYLLDVSKAALAADLGASDDPRRSNIWRILVDDTEAGEPWSLVAGNYAFAQAAGDAQVLDVLARIMSAAGAPFLGEADPAGGKDAAEGAKVWEQFRRTTQACWVGLAMPRFLLRLPYGTKTDRVEGFDFEEMPGVPGHGEYLWGNPAFALVRMLAEAFASEGWDMRPGAHSEIDGLPLHVYEADGEKQLKPCAEVLLTERDLDWIMDQGYMALASIRGRDAVRLVRFQSVAEPPARLAGRWE